jgi:hypothetical protein
MKKALLSLVALAPGCAGLQTYGHNLCTNAAQVKAGFNAITDSAVDVFCLTFFQVPTHLPTETLNAIAKVGLTCPECEKEHAHPAPTTP